MPVLCGSAFKNKGVQPLLDAVVDYLPSPLDVPPVIGHQSRHRARKRSAAPSDDEPFAALAFKIMTDPFVGTLTFFRVYSGVIESGSYVFNATQGQEGARRPPPADARQQARGDQGGLRRRHRRGGRPARHAPPATRSATRTKPIVLESIEFPEPVISIAIEPKTKADQEKLGASLQKLATEDPSFRVDTDRRPARRIISGMGELHLEIIVDRLLREFKVDANVGKPQVAYRETIRKTVEQETKFVRQTGGRGQYGHVVLRVEPLPPGTGFEFDDETKGGVVPREYIPAVEKGVREALEGGVLAGYPVVDVKVALTDGSYHEVDSSEMAFKIAGSMALQGGAAQGAAGHPRADHGGRGRRARGVHGRRDRRPERAAAAGSRGWTTAPARR